MELVYLIAANAALRTPLVRSAVGSAQGLTLEYDSAFSVIPGRARVRALRLRFEDYNVQFLLSVASAQVEISLHELFRRRFHVLELKAEDVRFVMRHKVESVGSNQARLDAYPRIQGFADPPLYQGTRPAPISDADYNLWQVHLENVTAEIRELWILEYRFSGHAEARGGFFLRPARWLKLDPSRINFRSGSLVAKPYQVAKRFTGSITCEVPGLDVRNASGTRPLGAIDARMDVLLEDGSLDTIILYTESRTLTTLAGPMRAEVRAGLSRGSVTPNSRIRVTSDDYRASVGPLDVSGRFEGTMERELEADPLRVRLDLRDSSIQSTVSMSRGPMVQHLTGELSLGQVNVTQPITAREGSLAATAIAPDLAWLEGFLSSPKVASIGGSANLKLDFQRDVEGHGNGELAIDLMQGAFVHDGSRIRTSGRALARFRTEESPRRFVQGALSTHLTGADSLLSLVAGAPLSDILSTSLDVEELSATVAFHASDSLIDLELTDARSGAVRAKGFLRRTNGEPIRGAALFSAGPIRVGVSLKGDTTSVSPLVSEDWLKEAQTHRGQ